MNDGAMIENKDGTACVILCGPTFEMGQDTIPSGISTDVYNADIIGAIDGLAAVTSNFMA